MTTIRAALGPAPTEPPIPVEDSRILLINLYGGGDDTVQPAQLPCGMDAKAAEFATLWAADGRNRHTAMTCDERLTQAAQERCRLMLNFDAVGHEVGDITENELVRLHGYRLPSYYAPRGNNIASLAAGRVDGATLLDDFWASQSGHKEHVFALSSFWRTHTRYGVAHMRGEVGSENAWLVWCLYTAPEES